MADQSTIPKPPKRLSRRLVRLGLPVAMVVATLLGTAGLTMINQYHNRRDTLALSDDLLRSLEDRIATEVQTYLAPASEMVRLASQLTSAEEFRRDSQRRASPFARYALNTHPQLSIFSYANTAGDFLMLIRRPNGALDTKIIIREDPGNRVIWLRRNPEGEVIDREEGRDDPYDPRTRPWFKGALKTRDVYWSDVYIFFTDQVPGLTAALALRDDNDETTGVIAADIRLEQLSEFLNGLKIGNHGRAMILDQDGRLVAYPDLDRMLRKVEGELRSLRVDELGDPVLTRAFNRFRIQGAGRREIEVEDRTYITTASSIRAFTGRDWYIMMVVPEEDFVGFVSRNSRRALLAAALIVTITGILAILTVLQGIRADREAQRVFERGRSLTQQTEALEELSQRVSLYDLGDDSALDQLSRIVGDACGARRVSLWGFSEGNRSLVCESAYDRETSGHTRGFVLVRQDFPRFFDALLEGREIVTNRAEEDPDTAGVYRRYLEPLGCDALLALPVQGPRQTILGTICLEDSAEGRDWVASDLGFVRSVAAMLGLRFSRETPEAVASQRPEPAHPRTAAARAAAAAAGAGTAAERPAEPRPELTAAVRLTDLDAERSAAFARAAGRSLDPRHTDTFPEATVLVVWFEDAFVLGETGRSGETRNVFDYVARRLEGQAKTVGLEYLKVLNQQIICAAGLHQDPAQGAHAIAAAALALQEDCARLLADRNERMDFQMGIDTGPILGSAVGSNEQVYNLWGQAIQLAEAMAERGLPGRIQVTESSYRRLRDHFLFKIRGSYYLGEVGELKTYLLTSRL